MSAPSAPISIPSASVVPSSEAASSPSSAGLYVPVHKRAGSDTSSHASSSRSASPISAERTPAPPHPYIYTRETLLALAQSPLAWLTPEARDTLRSAHPELAMNRKLRKSMEFRAAQQQRSPTPRRTRPAGRAPERRRNALKVVDEAAGNWRAMRVAPVPIAM